jgi:hypothetical protein
MTEALQTEPAPKNKGGRPAGVKNKKAPKLKVVKEKPPVAELEEPMEEQLEEILLANTRADFVPGPRRQVLERCIVARGRTVTLPHQSEMVATHSLDGGRVLYGPLPVDYGPGCEIELPPMEVARLRGLGFLLARGERMIDDGENGPRIVEEGPHARSRSIGGR